MADLGEEMEPVNTEFQSFKAELAKQLFPVIKEKIIPAIKGFFDKLKEHKIIDKVAEAVEWLCDNFDTLVKVAGTAVTVFGLLKGVFAITSTITAVKNAVTGLSAGIGVATKVQYGWNAAMSANPIGAVLTAVGLLATGITTLILTQDEATESTDTLSEHQSEAATAAKEAAEAYREVKTEAEKLAIAELSNIDHTEKLWKELQTLVDENGKVKKGYEARADFIIKELNGALGTEYKKNGEIISQYGEMKESIEKMIEAKKANILLEAQEKKYTEAVNNVNEAEQRRIDLAKELAIAKANEKKALDEYYENFRLMSEATDERTRATYEAAATAADEEWSKANKILQDKQAAYDESEELLFNYYADINRYETASTLITAGETEKAIGYLSDLASGFKSAEDVRSSAAYQGMKTEKEKAAHLKKTLEQQVTDTEMNAIFLRNAYNKGIEGVTEEMVATAEEQARKAKEEFEAVGGDITRGIAEGAEEEEWTLTSSMKGLIDKAVKAAKDAAGIESPSRVMRKKVGVFLGQGAGVGVLDSIPFVKKQINKFNDYVSSNLGNVKANASSLALSVAGGGAFKSKAKTVGNGEYTVVNAGITVNYNGNLSRKELKRIENDHYASVKTRLKTEGVIK